MFVRNTAVTIISCQLDIIHNCEQHAIQNLIIIIIIIYFIQLSYMCLVSFILEYIDANFTVITYTIIEKESP